MPVKERERKERDSSWLPATYTVYRVCFNETKLLQNLRVTVIEFHPVYVITGQVSAQSSDGDAMVRQTDRHGSMVRAKESDLHSVGREIPWLEKNHSYLKYWQIFI